MKVDFLIVGHGLAGATLGWQLRWMGQRVAVVDRGETNSASRVAAGLITPITGKRNTVSRRLAEFWSTALPFYRRVEEQTKSHFLYTDRTLRVVEGDQINRDEASPYILGISHVDAPYRCERAIELTHAARLCVGSYLDASRIQWQAEGRYFTHELDLDTELVTDGIHLRVPCLDVAAERVLLCQGFDAASNRLFGELSFEPAKGEVLELHVPSLQGKPTLLGEVWTIPTEEGRCLLGSTFDRDFDTALPTAQGREQLLSQFSKQVDAASSVLNHRAAIRPIMRGRMPQFGLSLDDSRFGFFNGLGSKGALRAPEAARQFASYLTSGELVDPEFWYEATPQDQAARRVTAMAHEIISEATVNGDVVIDATAGNGFDTLFLSQAVGRQGRVYAMDIQTEAISRTKSKLQSSGIQNAFLVLGSHAELSTHIPAEHHGSIAAIMFNLGYLPRGEKERTTIAATTIMALNQSVELLRDGAIMTIVAYPGHTNGYLEAQAIEEWISTASIQNKCKVDLPATKLTERQPRLYIVHKTYGKPADSNTTHSNTN